MDRGVGGWMDSKMDDRWVDGRRDGWVERQVNGRTAGWMDRGWTDRRAYCGMPTAQPSFHAIPSPISASCLLPQFPPNWSMSPERSQIPPAWEDPSLLVSHECHTALSSLPGDSG